MSDHGQKSPAVSSGRRSKLAWVTNVAAPYRYGVWAAVAAATDLSVGLLADNEPNRQWAAELPSGVPRLPTKAYAVHRGRLHMYVLSRPVLRGHFDAVILPGWELPASWQLLLEAKLRGIRTVGFYESSSGSHRFASGPVALLRRWFFRRLDAVVTVGEASRAAVLGFGVPAERVFGTFNAVDVATIHEQGLRTDETPQRAETFAYVGQLIHRKNVDGLIAAFAKLPPSTTLLVAGAGPQEQDLRAQVDALGLVDRVRFLGYVPYDRVPEVLAQASTLALCSHNEVYGLVVVEALAAGLHVVVTRRSGVFADVTTMDGVYGVDDDVAAIAQALVTSAQDWSGPVVRPEILARTPEAMASEVVRACMQSASPRPASPERTSR